MWQRDEILHCLSWKCIFTTDLPFPPSDVYENWERMDRYWKSWSCRWVSRECRERKFFPSFDFLHTHLFVSLFVHHEWCLHFVFQSIEKLYAKLRKGSKDEADIQVHRADVEKSLFKVLSYQAESVCVLSSPYKSLQVQRETLPQLLDTWMLGIEDLLRDRFPSLRCEIADLMFAFSVAII